MKKETVLYISDDCLELVVGCNSRSDMVKIYDFKKYPLLEGTMINGIITDEYEFKNVLKEIASQGYTNIHLVINSGQIIMKPLVVPKMNHKQILQIVEDELASISGNGNDFVYDYAYMSECKDGKKAIKIFCVGIDKTLLSSYITIFKSCDIQLESINTFTNVLNNVVKEALYEKHERYLVSLLDGNSLISVLYDNDEYHLSYRSRIVSSKDTSSFAQEIVSNISQISQFSKSGENSKPIEKVYFCYLDEQKEEILELMNNVIEIETDVFPASSAIYVVDETNKEKFNLDQYIISAGSIFHM